MRVFIGLLISADTRSYLTEIQNQLYISGAKGTLMRTENLHLTLEFIGEADQEKVRLLKKAMLEIAPKHNPFRLRLNKTGAFYQKAKAQVIWAGLSQSFNLKLLQTNLHQQIKNKGIELQERPFHPHITLISRIKTAPCSYPLLHQSAFIVDTICLFESKRINGKLYYLVIHQCPLNRQ